MIEYNIRIDLQAERTVYTGVCMTSGDVKAYRLIFKFFSEDRPYDVTGYTLHIRAKRADGVIIVDKGKIDENGLAFYDVKSSVYAVSGNLTMEVALASSLGEYVTTTETVMQVRGGYGSAGVTAENTVPLLAKLAEEGTRAEQAARAAEAAVAEAEQVLSFDVSAQSIGASETATVTKTEKEGKMLLEFGIPEAKTPEKGVDYFTEEDKADMVSAVLAALPDGDEVSY